ncbi:adenine deaminase C-terminal domain-containing protein [Bacillus alkalisoli]|uniref:adenine deaminase C-terminal domain-containing protein n=1 Tax=Bacillus alkalisoli TaxID=2011008 RepID=UPI000C231022|nr:adenine deaminase C-terminal domain-containing protein [Bacillus alkalisoli]
MMEQKYKWPNKKIREHVAVIDGVKAPTIVLQNATYLNVFLKRWLQANIWIYEDRIIYVGEALPSNDKNTEYVDCSTYFLVPGYIEPHVHPFQLYNPLSFGQYASLSGTTTVVNDNLVLALQLRKKKAFSFIREMNRLPVTTYWWSRFDAQTEIKKEEEIFSTPNIKDWLDQDSVLQGGELTSWPKLMDGDDLILEWIQETKRRRKPVEGHLPGASEKTLTKMKLFGVDSDHESMTGEDVKKRISQGYSTALRFSSIRPDLPNIIEELEQMDIPYYDHSFFTTDGSTPNFYKEGILDAMINIAIEKGVNPIEAYKMATFNTAKHFNIDHLHGSIAPGRIAHINILESKTNATPRAVLASGKWMKKFDQTLEYPLNSNLDWKSFDLGPLDLSWDLTIDDLQFSMALGLQMVNEVIMKPYSVNVDVSGEKLNLEDDQSFLMLIDRNGQWRVNTIIKGFSHKVSGLVSSYSNTGDIIIIGKNKEDMLFAFERMKAIGGGIVLAENQEIVCEISLPIGGMMSEEEMPKLIEEEEVLRQQLMKRGYKFNDPVYTLLFLSSTHLPYIRITPVGIYDVMNKTVLFPSVMR